MTRPSHLKATVSDHRTVAKMIAATVAPLFVAPALFTNIDWAAGIWAPWNIGAAAAVVTLPVFISAVFRAKSAGCAAGFAAIAGLLITWNTWGAFVSATRLTTDLRDHRATVIAAAMRLSEQRARLTEGRKSAVLVAGETPAAAIAADLARTIAAGARRWASTGGCDPEATTATASMRLCEQVATLRGQHAAAERRDALGAQLDRLDRESANLPAPADADPFTAAAADLAAVIGLPMSPGLVKALPAIRDAGRALVLELIAGFGPIALLSLWADHGPRPLPVPIAKPTFATTTRARVKSDPVTPVDQFAAFVTARLEKEAGGVLRAGDAFKAWQEHCAAQGIDAGKQKVFGLQMGARFKHDKNNNRPVYRGVRFRVELPEHVVAFRPKARA